MGPVLEKTREDSRKLEVICLWQESCDAQHQRRCSRCLV